MRRTKNKSFAWWDGVARCWRTFQASVFGGYETFPESFPKSGTMRGGELFSQPRLVLGKFAMRTGDWPTPRASNPGSRIRSKGGKVLAQEVETAEGIRDRRGRKRMWPTPKAMDGERTSIQVRARHDAKTGRDSLKGAVGRSMWPTPRTTGLDGGANSRKAAKARGMWPTPVSHDHKAPNKAASIKQKTSGKSKYGLELRDAVQVWPTPTATERSGTNPITGRGSGLSKAAKRWPTPQARDFRTGEGHRWEQPEKRSRNLNDAIAHSKGYKMESSDKPTKGGGQLNPTWVEWLMGYPLGWTELKR